MNTTLDATSQPQPWGKAIPLLILAALCAYANSMAGAYLLDDLTWIANNRDLPTLGQFTRSHLDDRWLIAASIELNYRLGGINPIGFHLLNLGVHITAGLVLFGIVRRTLLLPLWQGRYTASADGIAFATALLWLLHPLQTQSVTYVIQRCESLMGLFYLLTLYAVLRAAESPRAWLWQLGTIACFFLGLGCKEVIATAPIVILLYDWVFLTQSFKETFRRRWLAYLGMTVILGLFIALTALRLGRPAADVGFGVAKATPFTYLMSQAGVLLYYVRLSYWPLGQCLDYFDWPVTTSVSDFVLPGAFVGILVAASLVAVAFRRPVGFLGCWFFFILAPTSSVLPINDLAFEHRMYLSIIPLILLAVLLGKEIVARLFERAGLSARWAHTLQVFVLLMIAGTLGVLTFQRNDLYHDPYAMWQDVLRQRPENIRAIVYAVQTAPPARHAEEVSVLFERASKFNYNYWLMSLQLIQEHQHLYQDREAEKALTITEQKIHALIPANKVAISQAGLIWWRGFLDFRQGHTEAAAKHFVKVLTLDPEVASYHFSLAGIFSELGRHAEADAAFARGLERNATLPDIRARQARAALIGGDHSPTPPKLREALLNARSACGSMKAATPERLDALALALAALGRYREAADAARLGLERARAAGDTVWADALAQRLRLYEAGKPYRQTGA